MNFQPELAAKDTALIPKLTASDMRVLATFAPCDARGRRLPWLKIPDSDRLTIRGLRSVGLVEQRGGYWKRTVRGEMLVHPVLDSGEQESML